tara:strand:+ start:75 stop:356 length:282 start_codon:yes stop_codon:yes gene_type:complete
MELDINKSQLSSLSRLYQGERMKKQEVLTELKKTRTISTEMLPVIGMPFEIFLRYAKLDKHRQQKIVEKAIKKLDPEYCDACECTPCDCGYGS